MNLAYYDRLCQSLSLFFPDKNDHFLCPVCMSFFDKSGKDLHGEPRRTEAHLLPQAAGGRDYSYTCKKCNSNCGSAQDKWLGEYLKIIENGSNPLDGPTKVRNFKLNGVPLNGEIQMSEDNAVEVYIFNDKNNPKNLSEFFGNGNVEPRSIELSFPIDKHMLEVRVGALTTAYLTLFYHFGYSWVLQNHLQIVRDQIENPTQAILPDTFCTLFRKSIWSDPWVGFLEIRGILCLAYGYSNFLVIFPPVDQEEFYSLVPQPKKLSDLGRILKLPLAKSQSLPPYMLIFEHRLMIMPDVVKQGTVNPDIILFPQGAQPPEFRRSFPVSKNDFQDSSHNKVKMKVGRSHKRVSLNR